MPRPFDDYGNPTILRSPRQATFAFGMDQQYWNINSSYGLTTTVPRPKFLFMARFFRGPGQGGPSWSNGVSFAVKSVTRPTVTPEVVEMNQYNKKRLIHTGVKYGETSITFHDTTDSTVHRMWAEYADYHFGDFNQGDASWNYDITTAEYINNGSGFGYTPAIPASSVDDMSSSFFFERIEVYQFFGGYYVQFDLLHPKIVNFSPDALNYELGAESAQIVMNFQAESIQYRNGFIPAPIEETDIDFSQFPLDGDVLDVSGGTYGRPSGGDIFSSIGSALGFSGMSGVGQNLFGVQGSGVSFFGDDDTVSGNSSGISGIGGALGGFGNFNFGGSSGGSALSNYYGQQNTSNLLSVGLGALNGTQSNISGSLASIIGGPSLGSAFSGGGRTGNPLTDVASGILSSVGGPLGSIAGATFDSATSNVGISTSANSGITSSTFSKASNGLAGALIGSVLKGGGSPSNYISSNQYGVTPSPVAYGTMNQYRPTYSQYGYNTAPSINFNSPSIIPNASAIRGLSSIVGDSVDGVTDFFGNLF